MRDLQSLETNTCRAINAYCRVLELHMKAVEQGASPLTNKNTLMGRAVEMAAEGLAREVEFLTFLRTERHQMAPERGSIDPTSS